MNVENYNGGICLMNKIKIAIAGVGNCASSLIQGIYYYKDKEKCRRINALGYRRLQAL